MIKNKYTKTIAMALVASTMLQAGTIMANLGGVAAFADEAADTQVNDVDLKQTDFATTTVQCSDSFINIQWEKPANAKDLNVEYSIYISKGKYASADEWKENGTLLLSDITGEPGQNDKYNYGLDGYDYNLESDADYYLCVVYTAYYGTQDVREGMCGYTPLHYVCSADHGDVKVK